MVGNDYEKDILGARSVGMKAVFIDKICNAEELTVKNMNYVVDNWKHSMEHYSTIFTS